MTEATLVLERLGDLAGREAEHLAQDERGALARRQELQGDDEGQLDALALLVARVGSGALVALGRALVGIGLDPDRLDERRARPVVRFASPWSRGSTRLGRRAMD